MKSIKKYRLIFTKNMGIILLSILLVAFGVYYYRVQKEISSLRSELATKDIKIRDIDGELFYEKYRDRAITAVDIKPIVNNNRLITPIIKSYESYPFHLEVNITDDWDFGDFSFNYSDASGEYSYFLPIKYKTNENYQLIFRTWETEYTRCNFGSTKSDDLWTVNYEEITQIYSDIGLLRIGRSIADDYFVICQEDSSSIDEKATNWISYTDIGFILIKKPKDYDMKIINEMIKMLRDVNITRID